MGDFCRTFVTMMTITIGCARCCTDKQDLAAQKAALEKLGVRPERIYTDHGLTGTNRDRPGLDQALAAGSRPASWPYRRGPECRSDAPANRTASRRIGHDVPFAALDLQYRSGQPIHQCCVHRPACAARDCHQHGWPRRLARQRVCRAAVAFGEIRGGLFARL